jgi:hypothetical protein
MNGRNHEINREKEKHVIREEERQREQQCSKNEQTQKEGRKSKQVTMRTLFEPRLLSQPQRLVDSLWHVFKTTIERGHSTFVRKGENDLCKRWKDEYSTKLLQNS